MTVRELVLAVLLAVAGGCFVVGAALTSGALGWVVAGLVTVAWSLVVVGDVT